MSEERIQRVVDALEPDEAAKELAAVTKKLLSQLDEERRVAFLTDLIGQEGRESEDGLVHF